jgi:hypothetical protein
MNMWALMLMFFHYFYWSSCDDEATAEAKIFNLKELSYIDHTKSYSGEALVCVQNTFLL